MADDPSDPIRDHDARLAEAADELEGIAPSIKALIGADGRIADEEARKAILDLRQACLDVIRLAPAFGPAGLRAKARALLAPDQFDGLDEPLEVVLDGSFSAVELVQAFARDVLRLVPADEPSA